MAWANDALQLHHGTVESSARSIQRSGVDLLRCAPATDFGQGFYLTTNADQARIWANLRARTRLARDNAAVVTFDVSREDLAQLEAVVFVRDGPGSDFWDLVRYCRAVNPGHARATGAFYDLAAGPVADWPGTIVFPGYDQFSVHTQKAVKLLTSPSLHVGTPWL